MKLGPPPSPNRKKFPFVGSLVFQGIPIDIENAKGDVRTGVDKDGHRWRSVMHAHYGEFRNGVRGEDGDKIDVYVGPDESSGVVVIVNQNDPVTGKHDEQKCMLGFATVADALALYDRQYDRDGFRGTHVVMTVDDLKRKIVDKRNDGKALAKAMAAYLELMKAHGMPRSTHRYVARHPRKAGGYWYEYLDEHDKRMVHHRDGDHLPIRSSAADAGVVKHMDAGDVHAMPSLSRMDDDEALILADVYEHSDVKHHSVKEIGDAMAREVESIEHWRKFAFSGEGQDHLTHGDAASLSRLDALGISKPSLRRLVGAPDGVEIASYVSNGQVMVKNAKTNKVIASLHAISPIRNARTDFAGIARTTTKHDRSSLAIDNDLLDSKGVSGQSIGLRSLLTQVLELRRLEKSIGRTTITTLAAGTPGSRTGFDGVNGYVTWLLAGFRSSPSKSLGDYQANLSHKMSNQPIEQVAHSPSGRAWWLIHGGGFKAEFDPWDRYCLSALSAESARRLNARVHLTKSLTRSKERGNIDSLSNSASTSLMRSAHSSMSAANTWPSVSAVAFDSADSTTDATASASTSLAKAMAAWISDTEASPLAVSSARMNLMANSDFLDDGKRRPTASSYFSGMATSSLMQETLPNTISKHNVSRGGRSMSRMSITKACADFFSALTPQDAPSEHLPSAEEALASEKAPRDTIFDPPTFTPDDGAMAANGSQSGDDSSFQDENGDWWAPMDTALAGMLLMFGLEKGLGHKYIKRVPTGNPRRPYRYYYKMTARGGPHNRDDLKLGMSFVDARPGEHKGHWHIIEHNPGEALKIKHDETGEEMAFDRSSPPDAPRDTRTPEQRLGEFIHGLHAKDIVAEMKGKQSKAAAEAKEAMAHGSPKTVEAAKRRARKVGVPEREMMTDAERLADDKRHDAYMEREAAERDYNPNKFPVENDTTQAKADPPAVNTSILQYVERSGGKGTGPNAGEIFYDGTTKKHYVALKKKTERLSRREQEAAEDNGDFGVIAYHHVTARPASNDETQTFDQWKTRRDAARVFLKENEFNTTNGVQDLLAKPEYSKPGEKSQHKGEKVVVKPADKWGRQWSNAYIDKDGGRIELESNHDSYDDYRGESVYVAPYSDELAAAVRDAGSGHAAKLAEAKRDSMAPRPTVDIPKDVPPSSGPAAKERSPEPKKQTSKRTTEVPAKLGYRKTREGDWAVFGPAHALKPGAMHEVHTKAGDVRTEHVKRVSRPFDIGGIPHAYGYLKAGTTPPPGEAFAAMWKA